MSAGERHQSCIGKELSACFLPFFVGGRNESLHSFRTDVGTLRGPSKPSSGVVGAWGRRLFPGCRVQYYCLQYLESILKVYIILSPYSPLHSILKYCRYSSHTFSPSIVTVWKLKSLTTCSKMDRVIRNVRFNTIIILEAKVEYSIYYTFRILCIVVW